MADASPGVYISTDNTDEKNQWVIFPFNLCSPFLFQNLFALNSSFMILHV